MLTEEARDQLLQVIGVAGECIRQGAVLPSLILVYSAIDAVAWLGRRDLHPEVRAVFTEWVDRWLLPASPLPCSALELYAARCGVLHTFTSQSELATRGKVRRIAYTWGGVSVTDLQRKLDAEEPRAAVAVDIDALYNGLRLGTAQFFEDALTDSELSAAVEAKSRLYFASIRVEKAI